MWPINPPPHPCWSSRHELSQVCRAEQTSRQVHPSLREDLSSQPQTPGPGRPHTKPQREFGWSLGCLMGHCSGLSQCQQNNSLILFNTKLLLLLVVVVVFGLNHSFIYLDGNLMEICYILMFNYDYLFVCLTLLSLILMEFLGWYTVSRKDKLRICES